MKYIMTNKELTRLHVLKACIEGHITNNDAANRLHLTPRRIQQLKKAIMLYGDAAIIHGNTGKSNKQALSKELANKILDMKKHSFYKDCNFTHFREIILEQLAVNISYSSLYRLFSKNAVKSPKSRRRKKKIIHKSRERRAAFGMMLQADATPFAWFKQFGDTNRYALHGFIDDATNTVTGLYISKNECLLGYLEVLRQTLVDYGIPVSLYPDRYSVFFVNPKKEFDISIAEQLSGVEKRITQFGRIMETLGIDMFPAHSPQAKGRIERLWQTLQSRLPIEFAKHNISTVEEANCFLRTFLKRFNKQFAISPSDKHSAFVPVPDNCDLDRLLCAKYERVLSSGSTISLHNVLFKVEQNKFPSKTKVTILISQKHGLRALINGEFYPINFYDPNNSDFNSQATFVLKELIEWSLLRDAKAS